MQSTSSESQLKKQLRRLTILSIRNHWMGFSVLLILQWALGFYSEWFGALFGVVPRTVIEIHKVLGWILFWCAVILSIEKFLISRLKIRRAPIYDSWTRRLVRHHWIILLVGISLQLATTVYVGRVSEVLGVEKGLLTVWHRPIGTGIFLFALVLTAMAFSSPTARGRKTE